MKRGVPPTARNARTGLFTPPGVIVCAAGEEVGRDRGLVGVGGAVQRGHDPSVPCDPGDPSVVSDTRPRSAACRAAGSRVGTSTVRPSVSRSGRPVRPLGSDQPAAEHRRAGVDAGVDRRAGASTSMSRQRHRSRPTDRPSSSTRTVQTRRADRVPARDDAEDGDDRDHPEQGRDVAAGQHQVEHQEAPRAPRRPARTAARSRPARRSRPRSDRVSAGEQARGLDRPVGQHRAGAGPPDRGQRLEDRPLAVDPAVGRGRLDHRVLAADLVGAHRHVHRVGDPGDDVEVGQRRLDHDGVGALGEVLGHLAQRLVGVGRVHLVGRAVAELRRALGRLAERAVEAATRTWPRRPGSASR